MGCTASTIDNEQTVTRCKDRKHYIKLAVRHRHAFAAAHMAYIQSLKNTGAALRQFTEGDSRDPQVTDRSPDLNPNSNPCKPPPLPGFLTVAPSPQLARASSMPHFRNSARTLDAAFSPSGKPPVVQEGDEDEGDNGNDEELDDERREEQHNDDEDAGAADHDHQSDARRRRPSANSSSSPAHRVHRSGWQKRDAADVRESEMDDQPRGDADDLDVQATPPPPPSRTKAKLSYVLGKLDNEFLNAFERGKHVARLLEARKMHYHHNSAGYSDSVDHSSRVLRVMSWGRNPDMGCDVDRIVGDNNTHASTLDKLLAWEKKLHDEVKAGEQVRIKLEKKSELLRVQRKREESLAVISETKASIKSLHTRYVVEIQAVDAATFEVNKLRDEHLHKQLAELVKGLSDMWEGMSECHKQQYQAMASIEGFIDRSVAPAATDDQQFKKTEQLEKEINGWQESLELLLRTQKDYMDAVYNWLKLHLIQIESDGKDATGSPPKMTTPAIYYLCKAWRSNIDRLPSTAAMQALMSFAKRVEGVRASQMEERRQKRKLEEMRKEAEKKEQVLARYKEKWRGRSEGGGEAAMAEEEEEGGGGGQAMVGGVKEKERMVKMLRDAVEVERLRYEEMCRKSGSMALSCLEDGLPPVLKAMRDFAHSSSQCYSELSSLALLHGPPSSSFPQIAY